MRLGYARVSRLDQNLDLQTDALTAAGAEHIYKDSLSGANLDRPGLKDLMSHVRRGDTVIVWRLDRLARSLKDLIDTAVKFEAAGVALILLNEGIDMTTSAGKLFFSIIGAIAEFERNIMIERTHAGLQAARDRGRFGGRPPILNDEKKNALRLQIEALKTTGEAPNWRSLGRSVEVSERTVRRFVSNEYKRAA